jgi:hypothetical protein
LGITSAVAADDELGNGDMLALAYLLRGLTPDNVGVFTAPVRGTGTEGAASVGYLDDTVCGRMWTYLQTDSFAQNAAAFSDDALADIPR